MTKTLTQSNHQTTIEVVIGDTIAITLPETPTTGYRWTVHQMNEQIVALQTKHYTIDGNALGNSGKIQFLFQAVAIGTTTLYLKNWREWEGDLSIIQRFEITIRVVAP